jgi:class 3 adenylate cyclase
VLCGTLAPATALADRLGLEAFRHLVQTFHTLAQECVQRYEGTIQTLDEEGVLALFGVLVAQEERAWRAVQAALALQQRLQSAPARHEMLPTEALTARVGVHTGWVVAGSHSDEGLRPAVVGGDTTQGAMRLQGLAEPGTVLVSDTTLRLLGEIALHSHPPDIVQAEIYYQQALALAEELGMRPLQAHCHRGLGTLSAKLGQREQSRTTLSTAIALYRAMEMTFWLPEAQAALAQVA